jgi:diadenosine tetraphosphate (Ap4A) HIT family hydrolase
MKNAMTSDCPFCDSSEAVLSNELSYVRLDKYPVSSGHLLIVPYRHIASYFDATVEEKRDLLDSIEQAKVFLEKQYSPDGYNIGINCGVAAGQTVMHLHIHLIPRHKGDVDDPTGGVRGVIPSKQKY